MKKNDKHKNLYTTIIHECRIRHGLSNNDYCIAYAIYHLSNDPSSKFKGWYFGRVETLGSMFDFSRATAYNSVTKLIEKNLVEKDIETGFLRTTKIWWNEFVNNSFVRESKN